MLKRRQLLGKYRIEGKLAEGGFAAVYRAFDTIEGIRVALKIPHPHLVTSESLDDFRREVRLAARLDHPNILPLKSADFVDGRLVLVFALGQRTLADRLRSRLSLSTALDFAEQLIAAVAYAHQHGIIHCDIKPENLILFDGNRLRLTDFGIAKVAMHTVSASGSGTIGHLAPEQAMGKPSRRSDVFSVGLIVYRMLSGSLPAWPFDWPPPGFDRIRGRAHPELIALLRRALQLDPGKRFPDADQMLTTFQRLKPQARRYAKTRRRRGGRLAKTGLDWQAVRRQLFQRQYRRELETRYECHRCGGPVSEAMQACPWCGVARKTLRDETRFPIACPRCERGMKSDWRFCPWCFGPGFDPSGHRSYPDARYCARCSPGCGGPLMPHMRYCPWCRRKVRKKWRLPDSAEKCPRCGWGVLPSFWSYCAWCRKSLAKR